MQRLLSLCFGLLFAQSGRYWDSLFTWRVETVTYGSATNAFGTLQTLRADFYLPEPDNETSRPVIVLLFGGGYISGSRNDADITHLARYFAARGYVAATIDYRIGMTLPTATEWIKAGTRAVHDLKAFIRYLKKSVVSNGNPYGIDTARIYVGGSSAGAVTALHAAFLSSTAELSEVPEADTTFISTQGGLEGNSGNPGYSSRFSGVFSLSGGILRTSWISANETPAVIAMHGTGDATVPYKSGLLPFISLSVEGGYNIDSVAALRGLYHALFTWQALGHVPYGTQTSVNPLYMKDVEEFLRFHFYQWNSRFATSINTPTSRTYDPASRYQVWSIDGRYVGEMTIDELPQGVWALRHPTGHIQRVFRP
ncbi:MAG: alpha/beta hydrolase [Bacteroidia bacterium]|nr:alpha/beta hydrolase [Bacteroidia bacterium]MCX7653022.1 alpha/beta hydrolase [Bacteroidia bacterium]MDW8416160.1 alpha/beta hydrolase [Bacteroidia bacterium]